MSAHDGRHPGYCWCRWAWAGRERWAPATRDADTEDGQEDVRR